MNSMSNIGKTSLMILSAVEFLVGIFGNGFIILVFTLSWVRNRRIFLVDLILTCLALSRIWFLWITISFIYCDFRYKKVILSPSTLIRSNIIWTGSAYFCTGSTTCLNVFYFLKIGNFSNPGFLWMKQRLHKVLLMIVMGTVFHFFVFLILVGTNANKFMRELEKMKTNMTFSISQVIIVFIHHHVLINIILIVLFVVSLTSLLLLILSLWSHSRRMKLQGIYSRDSSTEAHVKAMKSIISCLLFFIVYYLSHIMMTLSYSILDNIVAKTFAYFLVFLYPSCHPFFLILWNSKLKQAWLCVLRQLKCVRAVGRDFSFLKSCLCDG